MKIKGSQLLKSWSQDSASKKANYPKGMCILFSFYFGLLRMRTMDLAFSINEIVILALPHRKPCLDILSQIYADYLKQKGNFKDEIIFVGQAFKDNKFIPELDYFVDDYDSFDIQNQSYYSSGLHSMVAADIQQHYFRELHTPHFLMIGYTTISGEKHALSLIITPEEQIILFDPNLGWYNIQDLDVFLNEYGNLARINHWDLVMVKMQ